MTAPTDYFDRFLALQQMILEASEDLKQLRADAIEELITEATPKDKAKEIRADLAEVIALAKIKAKGDMEERKQAEKMARRRRVAEECGVQLDLLGMDAVQNMRRSIASGEVTIEAGGERLQADGRGGVESVSAREPHPHKGARGKGLVGRVHDKLVEAGMQYEGGNQYSPPPASDSDEDDDHGGGSAPASREPAAMHASGMSERDWNALGDIPEFLRRS